MSRCAFLDSNDAPRQPLLEIVSRDKLFQTKCNTPRSLSPSATRIPRASHAFSIARATASSCVAERGIKERLRVLRLKGLFVEEGEESLEENRVVEAEAEV